MKNVKKAVSLVVTLIMVISLLVVPATSVSAAETTKKEWKTFEELVKEKGYLNGIQQPWMLETSTGNDIGRSAVYRYGRTNFNEESYYELFRNSKAMGFEIVQLWITYTLGGIQFDDEWQVTGLEPEFAKNFPRVLEIAEECGVYLCLTIVEHEEAAFPIYANKTHRYEEVYRFLHNEKSTKMFVDNWLIPVLEMTKKHENVIMANVFAEPEANGGRWGVDTGASWENMTKFLKTVNDAIHKHNPRITTFAGATRDVPETFTYYEDIDLDCYGYDYYSKGDIAHDTSELLLNKPLVYGEFGIDPAYSSYTKDDDYMQGYFSNYLETAAVQGVKAGFFWYYGFPGKVLSTIDAKSRLRPFTWAIRSWALDNEYKRTGYEGIDAPAFMYSTSEAIRWYGSRGATKMMMQRSKDGKTGWKTVLSFDPDTAEAFEKYEYGAMMYEWIDPEVKDGETWYYRAVAADDEGNERESEVMCIKAAIVTCSEEENLIKNGGFEEGPISICNLSTGKYSDGAEGWQVANQWYPAGEENQFKHFQNGEHARTGKGSAGVITRLFQTVTLKPYTDYTLTYYYKYDEVEGLHYSLTCFTTNFPASAPDNPESFKNSLIPAIEIPDKNKKIGWQRQTVTFNSGTETEVQLMFYASQGYEKWGVIDWHVDDVYLFESKK